MLDLYLTSGNCKIGGGKFNLWTDFDEVNKAQISSININLWLMVDITSLDISDHGTKYIYSYVRGFFDPNIWDIKRFGLIYSDDVFEQEANDLLINDDLATENIINYSEQGRQGHNFVDFDVDYDWVYNFIPAIKSYRFSLRDTTNILTN